MGLVLDLRARGVALRLARVHRSVLLKLERAGVLEEIGEDAVFARVADAGRTLPDRAAPVALTG